MRVATLPKADYFNEVVDTDVFWVQWKSKRKSIMSVMDEYSRFEVDHVLKKENPAHQLKILDRQWLDWAGPMKVLRLDLSGSHASQKWHDWASAHGVQLDFGTAEAHHRLGMMERNHAVRREPGP